MKAKWLKVLYILVGVLLPIPINLLARHFNYLRSRTFSFWYTLAEYGMVFFSYFFLGAFIAGFKKWTSFGTPGRWRVRWPEFALGAGLFVMGFVMKLELSTHLVTSIPFVYESDVLFKIFRFNDSLYTWVLLSGFFLADAFDKVPLEEAGADGPREET